MAEDVTTRSYGLARAGEPLTDAQQQRLRELAGKSQRTAQEAFELGSLKARGRSTTQGRQVLEDIGHEEAAAQSGRRSAQGHPRAQQRPAQSRTQARSSRMSDREYERNYRMLGEYLDLEGS